MPVARQKRAPERKFYESPVPANDNEPESRATSGENDRRYDGNASGQRVYAYAGNDPVNGSDPSGMAPISVQEAKSYIDGVSASGFGLGGGTWTKQTTTTTNSNGDVLNVELSFVWYPGDGSAGISLGSPFLLGSGYNNNSGSESDRAMGWFLNKSLQVAPYVIGGLEIGAAEAAAAAEAAVVNEARSILTSPEMANIAQAYANGESLTVNIGGRMIQYEPGLPASGMTMFGENGFLMGPEAFQSNLEQNATVLQELYRLRFSQAASGVSGDLATFETQSAFSFANRHAGSLP